MSRRERKPQAQQSAAPPRRRDRRDKRTQYDTALALHPARVLPAGSQTDLSFGALGSALLVALAYAALALAGRALAAPGSAAPALWPAGGLLLAVLLLSPRRQWPLVLGLAFVAQTAAGLALGGPQFDLGPGFALAACAQAYIAARLLARSYRLPFRITGLRELFGLAVAAGVGAVLGGLAQAAFLVAGGAAASLASAWAAWGLAGTLGVLAVTPAIVIWAEAVRAGAGWPGWRAALEPAAAALALAGATGAAFGIRANAPGAAAALPYLVLPCLLWAAVRLGRPGAAAAVLLLGIMAAWFTARGLGPFAGSEAAWLQVYLGVAALCTLGLGVVLARRGRAAAELQQAHARLSTWARDLEQRNRQVGTLTRMGDLLQSCMTAEDAHHVIALTGPQLFPGVSGALYLLTPDRSRAWAAATWGPLRLPDMGFAREDCLALRRGRLYAVGLDRPARPCRHVQPAHGLAYLCMPLLAMNEVMGVLHLCAAGPRAGNNLDEATVELARAAADSMALALGYVGLRQTLREQSIRDPLTGLFNRRYMEETLERELRRARRGGYPVGLIMLDLDHFKGFNDDFGHEAGDAALRELGNYLQLQVRGDDVACRYGGEEFTLILPNADFAVTRERAEQLRAGVKDLRLPVLGDSPGRQRGRALGPLTLSLGLATFPAHGATGAEVLRAADAALYRAKQQGRDRVAAPR